MMVNDSKRVLTGIWNDVTVIGKCTVWPLMVILMCILIICTQFMKGGELLCRAIKRIFFKQ